MPHSTPVWLAKVRKKRRTLKNIKTFLEPDEIWKLLENSKPWPYKRNADFFQLRDKALVCLLYLLGCRVNEVLRLEKSQIHLDLDPDFVIVKDFEISKRKKATLSKEGIPKIDFPLPVTGKFAKFTMLFLDHLDQVEGERLFNIGRTRAWQIVKHLTGKWCHYFRSQRLSYLVNLLQSAMTTSKLTGIKNPQTIAHYYKTEWTRHKDKLKL